MSLAPPEAGTDAPEAPTPKNSLDRFFEITERGSTWAGRSAAASSPSSRWPTSWC